MNSTARNEVPVEIINIPVDQITPSKTNRTVSASAVADMAASIRKQGVLQPITVRSLNRRDDIAAFELVLGETRWRGAKEAGLAEIAARVGVFTDEEAQSAQIIENLQRTNPSPLDEAESYDNLRKLIGKNATIAQVSAQVGKPEPYIAQRLKLLDLTVEARKALQKESIGLGHALLIAPLEADVQKSVVKWLLAGHEEEIEDADWNVKTVKTVHTVPALRAFIERNFFLTLANAPFDTQDAKLVPQMGACGTCPHNTINSGSLFPDHSKIAVCTLPSCFYEKRNKTVEAKVAEAEKEGGKVYRLGLGSARWNEGPGKIKVDGYLVTSSYQTGPRLVKKGDECKTSKTAVLVFRASDEDKALKADLGDTTTICANADCPKHAKQRSSFDDTGSARKALSGMAFVSHKQTLLAQSRPERLRWAVYKALSEKLPESAALSAQGVWTERIEAVNEWARSHLSNDCARDAVKALGLWDKKKKAAAMDWRKTLAKHFEGKPWAYLLALTAAAAIRGDTWGGKHNVETNRLFRLARSFKVDIAKIQKTIQGADREMISGMTARAKAKVKAKQPKIKVKVKAKKAA